MRIKLYEWQNNDDDDLQSWRLPNTAAIQPCKIVTLLLTDRAAAAIREISVRERAAPTVTWDQTPPNTGQWMLGFHRIDAMSEGFLACDIVEANGVSLVIDGPLSKRELVESSELDYVDGCFVVGRTTR